METKNKTIRIFLKNSDGFITPELSNQVRKNYLLIRNILYEYF